MGHKIYKDVIDLTRMAIQTGLLLVARQCRALFDYVLVAHARQCRDVACSIRLVLSFSDAARSVPTMLLFSLTRSFQFSVFRISVRSILK